MNVVQDPKKNEAVEHLLQNCKKEYDLSTVAGKSAFVESLTLVGKNVAVNSTGSASLDMTVGADGISGIRVVVH